MRVGCHTSKRKTLFVTLGLAFLFGLNLGLDYSSMIIVRRTLYDLCISVFLAKKMTVTLS